MRGVLMRLPCRISRFLSTRKRGIAVRDATLGLSEIDMAVPGHLNRQLLDEAIDRYRSAGIIDDQTMIVGFETRSC